MKDELRRTTYSRKPPAAKERNQLLQRWSGLRDRDRIAVCALVLDMGDSSRLVTTLGAEIAHQAKELFRNAIGQVTVRWGGYPIRDYMGDATALLLWKPEHAIGAALDVLLETGILRRKLATGLLRRLESRGARGFRIGGAYGDIVFDHAPGRCTGLPLDIAGHLLKKCPAPGLLLTRSLYEEHLTNGDRQLFEPQGPVIQHVDRFIPTVTWIGTAKAGVSTRDSEAQTHLSPLESQYWDHLYHFKQHHAATIRLVGAGDEYFPEDAVHTRVDQTPYVLPPSLLMLRDQIVRRLEKESKEQRTQYWDGPHVRLISYHATVVNKTAASEQKHLSLTLGPLGWYDYSVANQEWGKAHEFVRSDQIREYLDLDEIAHDKEISNVKLSNILVVLATIVTTDGRLLYSRRSARLAAYHGKLITAVSENIHQVMDHALEPPRPGEAPVPFRTVLRGIGEELSEKIRDNVRSKSVFLLGLSFHFQTFHPSIPFLVALPLSFPEVLEMCREWPGRDFVEGKLESVEAFGDRAELHRVLSDPNWIPGGKAAVIRAAEFLDALQARSGMQPREIIELLSNGNIPPAR